MNGVKLAFLGLIGLALLVFGYRVYTDKTERPAIPVASNAAVDYANSLSADVKLAQQNADKYEAAARDRMNRTTADLQTAQ